MARADDVASGMLQAKLFSRQVRHPRGSAQKVNTIALVRAQRADSIHKIDSAHSPGNGHPFSLRRPKHSDTVWSPQVCFGKNLPPFCVRLRLNDARSVCRNDEVGLLLQYEQFQEGHRLIHVQSIHRHPKDADWLRSDNFRLERHSRVLIVPATNLLAR